MTVVEISNPDKVMFPDDGITKADLAGYYEQVAETMLPYVRGRPVHMQRFPDGIGGPEIQQKQVPDYFPDFVRRVEVGRKGGGSVTHLVMDNVETIVYLADQACITPHTWLARDDRLDNPDLLIFDLDPVGGGVDLDALRDGARTTRELLEELGLAVYLKTTGSRGYHVVVPLDRSAGFDQVRAFAREVAKLLASRDPELFTVEQRKDKRRGRLYLDTARNAYAQTAVAPYAVRALPGAPVAVPIDWRELGRVEPRSVTLQNAHRRLSRRRDPWAGMWDDARPLREPGRRLEKLRA
jgi:bifunctional non-homologous end joining protein LigD